LKIEFIRAKTSNLDRLIEIWKDFMDYHKKLDPFFTRSEDGHLKFRSYMESVLNNDDYLLLVVWADNSIEGYALAQVNYYPPVFERTRHCLLTDIVLTEALRGKGIGKQLFEEVKKWSLGKDLDRIELRVVPQNKPAYDFYTKLGFRAYLHDMFIEL
jgi:GNAT superfamily N-acetyltransferase